jgi:hypothetical protein
VLQRNAQPWQKADAGILCSTKKQKQQSQQKLSATCTAAEQKSSNP